MSEALQELARNLCAARLANMPVGLRKQPVCVGKAARSWKTYFQECADPHNPVAAAFRIPPDGRAAGLAVVCGKPSDNLVVLDIDDGPGGPDALLAEWKRLHPGLAGRVPVVQTGGGGYHVYFRVDTLPAFTLVHWYRGGDRCGEVRANDCYVVGRDALHASGRRYELVAGSLDAIPMVGRVEDGFCPAFADLGPAAGGHRPPGRQCRQPARRATGSRSEAGRPKTTRTGNAVARPAIARAGTASAHPAALPPAPFDTAVIDAAVIDAAVRELKAAAGVRFGPAYAEAIRAVPGRPAVRHGYIFRLKNLLARVFGTGDVTHPGMTAAFRLWYVTARAVGAMRTTAYAASLRDWLQAGPAADPDHAPFLRAVRRAAAAAAAAGETSRRNIAATVVKAAARHTGGRFFLSCETLRAAVGAGSKTTAWRDIDALIAAGLIRRVESHGPKQSGTRLADEYELADPVAAGHRSPDPDPVTPGEIPKPLRSEELNLCVYTPPVAGRATGGNGAECRPPPGQLARDEAEGG